MRRLPLLFFVVAGCSDPGPPPAETPATGLATWTAPLSLAEVAMETCDTPRELVDGLSAQLVDAINCLRPGTLSDIPLGPDIGLLREGRPAFVDARGLDDLLAAADAGDRQMIIRWSYRDVALQHLFWLQDDFRGCAVAAPAGLSNHQNGLAVDLNDRQYWEPIMARNGWANLLPNDRVHFDYQRADDVGLGALSLLAFQALWNKNNPDDPVATSSELDGPTYDALSQAPIEGFPMDLCEGGAPPVGPGPVRGPTVAQSAWRGCSIPGPLRGGLAEQIVEAIECERPGALVPLRYCAGPGCLTPDDEIPPLEYLGADAHAAILQASEAEGEPLPVSRAFIDVATQRFLSSAASNIGCPRADGTARSPYNSGLAIEIANPIVRQRIAGDAFTLSSGALIYAAGDDLTELGVLAFQKLWNVNREDDPIDEDGLIGPQTRGAIDRAPIAGFPQGLCGGGPDPEPEAPQPEPEAPEPEAPEPEAPQPEAPEPESPQPEAEPEGPQPEAPEPESPQPEAEPEGPSPDGGAPGLSARAPAPGWSALADDDGCRQRPGAPGGGGMGWLLLGWWGWRRRRASTTVAP